MEFLKNLLPSWNNHYRMVEINRLNTIQCDNKRIVLQLTDLFGTKTEPYQMCVGFTGNLQELLRPLHDNAKIILTVKENLIYEIRINNKVVYDGFSIEDKSKQ